MTEAAQPIQSIVGLSLSGIGRALNMGIFSFGPDVTWIDSTTRETRIDSKYAIHVQCPFRLTRNGHTLVGSDDMRIPGNADRKSTRLNSSHLVISYAVFCLKKKKYYISSRLYVKL